MHASNWMTFPTCREVLSILDPLAANNQLQITLNDKPKIDSTCNDMEELLVKLEDLHRRETELMQEAFPQDVGGQG
jgi:hypothetical protein